MGMCVCECINAFVCVCVYVCMCVLYHGGEATAEMN